MRGLNAPAVPVGCPARGQPRLPGCHAPCGNLARVRSQGSSGLIGDHHPDCLFSTGMAWSHRRVGGSSCRPHFPMQRYSGQPSRSAESRRYRLVMNRAPRWTLLVYFRHDSIDRFPLRRCFSPPAIFGKSILPLMMGGGRSTKWGYNPSNFSLVIYSDAIRSLPSLHFPQLSPGSRRVAGQCGVSS